MKADATLEDLDDFLRGEWLECCGHLSKFDIGRTSYMVPFGEIDGFGPFADRDERSMEVTLGEALGKGTSFRHEYDFGSTTELKLRVVDERRGHVGGQIVRRLSQNEAPVWECDECGDEAAWICTYCIYEKENPFYCELHAEDHDCDEPEMLLPVVNSPRMGVCGYAG